MSDYLLDLSTVHVRQKISIDDEPHEMKNWDDFGMLDISYFQTVGQKVQKMGSGDLTEKQIAEVTQMVNKMIDMIFVDLPANVQGRLVDWQKLKIIEAFTVAVTPKEGGEAAKLDGPLTGENSSPDSAATTAETPNAG